MSLYTEYIDLKQSWYCTNSMQLRLFSWPFQNIVYNFTLRNYTTIVNYLICVADLFLPCEVF